MHKKRLEEIEKILLSDKQSLCASGLMVQFYGILSFYISIDSIKGGKNWRCGSRKDFRNISYQQNIDHSGFSGEIFYCTHPYFNNKFQLTNFHSGIK